MPSLRRNPVDCKDKEMDKWVKKMVKKIMRWQLQLTLESSTPVYFRVSIKSSRRSDIQKSWRRFLRPIWDFYQNHVNQNLSVEVQDNLNAFSPQGLQCSVIIAEKLSTCKISVQRKEQNNRVYPQTQTPIDNPSWNVFYRARTQNKTAVAT